MNKLIFLILIFCKSYSQEISYERFIIENNKIIWQNIYQKDSIKSLENLRKNLSLTFTNDNSGFSKGQKVRCKNIAIYMNAAFAFNFQIDEKEDKFRVRVSNIIFDDEIQLNIGGIQTSGTSNPIEDYELRKTDNTFRKNSQSKTNLTCLDEYFKSLFTPTNKDW